MINFNNLWSGLKNFVQELNRQIWTSMKSTIFNDYTTAQSEAATSMGVVYQINPRQVSEYLDNHGLQLVKTLTETDKAAFKTLLEKNFDLPFDQFMEKARGSFVASDARAKVIWNTEIHEAYTNGYDEYVGDYVRKTGKKIQVTWHHGDSKIPRPEHLKCDNETVQYGETFSNGLRLPTGPNCSCYLSYSEQDKEE